MKTKNPISRRKFLATSGGITFMITGYALMPKFNWLPDVSKEKEITQVTAWVRLNPDGKVTIYNPAAEMGQGSMTALPVILAEEMDADWSKVKVVHAPVEPEIYGRSWGRSRNRGGTMMTVGSRAVSGYFNMLRNAGAQARYVLLYSVSKEWQVPIEELSTESGVVIHAKSNRKISYGDVVAFAQMPDKLPEFSDDQLKSPENFRLIGKSVPRVDIPEKVNGSAQYGMDIMVPGMVYGVITRSPIHGAKPTRFNKDEINGLAGVLGTVILDHGIGIIAETIYQALEAKKQLKISWDENVLAKTHSTDGSFSQYLKMAEDNSQQGRIVTDQGNIMQELNNGGTIYKTSFENDYVYHSQMEPLNAVVSILDNGSAEVWAGTQYADGARNAVAGRLGIDRSKVNFHPCYLGGGFGRRSLSDYIIEAVDLAWVAKKPLKLIWTREDDLQYGTFRPICLQHMQASVDNNGNITAWWHNIVGTGGGLLSSGAEIPFYNIPNQRIEVRNIDHGVRTKHWRAVGHGPNKFAIEAFIDEIARDQKIDPYQFRKKLMVNSPRALKVLDKVAQMANWGTSLPDGHAMGIAFAERSGSLSAGVVEISVNRDSGKIKVHKVWMATDAGIVVQPDNATAQIEGSINMGLSSVLLEKITIKEGKVEQSNFNNYNLLRMADAPEEIHIEFIPSDAEPNGIGEAGLPVMGGAVASAFASLTGKYLRKMPFTPDRVKEALQS